jgi:hypothetical protein
MPPHRRRIFAASHRMVAGLRRISAASHRISTASPPLRFLVGSLWYAIGWDEFLEQMMRIPSGFFHREGGERGALVWGGWCGRGAGGTRGFRTSSRTCSRTSSLALRARLPGVASCFFKDHLVRNINSELQVWRSRRYVDRLSCFFLWGDRVPQLCGQRSAYRLVKML